jgi:hypothetical protein
MRLLRWGLLIVLALFVLVQLVPYGRAHDNPPVGPQPPWDARTAELARSACMDCHSNETTWPWYSHVAPVSWLVQYDVESGREHLNFSQWGSSEEEGEDLVETVREGEMPPWFYPLMHRDARLSATEKDELARGLERIAPAGAAGEQGGSDDD